jgi:DNA-binding NarL/FixJ family response regulator
LIVDDHPNFRSLARRLLEMEGYVVVGEAKDGVSAVAAAITLQPELVLLDIQLPDCDGFQVARDLKEHAPTSQVVLVSSRDARDYGPLLGTSPARGFISKAELSGVALAELLGETR